MTKDEAIKLIEIIETEEHYIIAIVEMRLRLIKDLINALVQEE